MVDFEKRLLNVRLPSSPSVAAKLLELFRDPNSAIQDFIDVIKSDPAISSNILKTCNSSYFGFSHKIIAIEDAVPLLGKTAIFRLALSFSLSQQAVSSGAQSLRFRHYWEQSLIQATAAEMLIADDPNRNAHDGFMVGLLSDIGRLAMLQVIPDEYLTVLQLAESQNRPLHDVEFEQLGTDHLEVGKKLAVHWNLPYELQQTIAYHHVNLSQIRSFQDDPSFDFIKAAVVASLVGELMDITNSRDSLEKVQESLGELYGFTRERTAQFAGTLKSRVIELSEMFSFDAQKIQDPLELLADANERLSSLVVHEQVAHTQAMVHKETIEEKVDELTENYQQLQEQAFCDPLTKIYNRQFFDESLRNAIQKNGREKTALGLFFADIDHFKQINDQYGHLFGDVVLRRIATLFQQAVREYDIVARYGGEEFVVILHTVSEKVAMELAERLREKVESESFKCNGRSISVTVSIGVAITIPKLAEPNQGQQLIASADEAMYRAKRLGRNQCQLGSKPVSQSDQFSSRAELRRFSCWLIGKKLCDQSTIKKILTDSQKSTLPRLGELATHLDLLSSEQVDQICVEQKNSRLRFGEIAIQLGLLSEETVLDLLAIQQENPYVLSQALVDLGLFSEPEINELQTQYFAQFTSQSHSLERVALTVEK